MAPWRGGAVRDTFGAALDKGVGIPDICRSCSRLQKCEERNAEPLFFTLPEKAAEGGVLIGIALDPLQLQAQYTRAANDVVTNEAQTR